MSTEQRFEFGANWSRFLDTVDEQRINAAVGSLQAMLQVESLKGQRFLDAGSGSGLFSLAAHRLGAIVHSFDYDGQSVACTQEMKQRYAPNADSWSIDLGSALDPAYLARLEAADIVYSWGVLHHTGRLWTAIDLVSRCVKPNGRFWLAIYNDQGPMTQRWIRVKRTYQQLPVVLRPVLCGVVGGVLLMHRICSALASSAIELLTCGNPMSPLRRVGARVRQPDPRGMSRWYDLVDWVGGWPFEVARPEDVISFLAERGFELEKLKTVGGNMGCNEFVMRRR